MGVLNDFQKLRVRVYGSVTELTEVPGIVARAYRTPRSSGFGYKCRTELPGVPGTSIRVRKNFPKFRVMCGTGVQNLRKFRAGMKMLYPYPGCLWHWRTELTKVPGTGNTKVNSRLRGRNLIYSGGFHRT